MTTELTCLALSAALTGVLWVPYILNMIVSNSIGAAVGYPSTPITMSPWAERLKKAHYISVENLVVFASLVLVANAADIRNAATQTCAMTYFWARVVHTAAYTAAIPWVRTLAFAVAWAAIACIAWQVLVT